MLDATANLDRINTEEKITALVQKIKETGFNTLVLDVKPIVGVNHPHDLKLYPEKFKKYTDLPVHKESAAAEAQPPFEFGDEIVATTDPAQPDNLERVLPLPPDPRTPDNPEHLDYFEFQKRLVIKDDRVDVLERLAAGGETIFDGLRRECRVVANAGEALLLRGGDDAAVGNQRRGAVVVEGRDAEDVHAALRTACR